MDRVRIDRVGDRGADGTARLVRRAEHEMVDEQLRATIEELGERLRPRLGLEAVVLLDRHPGELPPLLRERVAAPGELLLFREQLPAGRVEFLLCADLVLRHCLPPVSVRVILLLRHRWGPERNAMRGWPRDRANAFHRDSGRSWSCATCSVS